MRRDGLTAGCGMQVIELQLSMASLVYSLIEENGPRELLVATVRPLSLSVILCLFCVF